MPSSRRADRDSSVFLAIKYASPAMGKLWVEKGKTIPGGSIILTASGALSLIL